MFFSQPIVTLPRYQKGVTLLEMLVVFVFFTLISAILLQGFSYILTLREKAVAQTQLLQTTARQEYWFRSTVRSLTADYTNIIDNDLFQGNRKTLTGLSLAALNTYVGVPTRVKWEIENTAQKTSLYYQENKKIRWEVMSWQGEEGEFSYLDKYGIWHNTWPPQQFSQTPLQLPHAIRLFGLRHGKPFLWLVSITGRKHNRIDFRIQ